ncbi:hypothetical protein PG593_03640 [Riemerella anatipestifer]|uniref:hypothetical protein n=1 Tax=Riemerella anatipestifer TaxID=34085 RepID=UPI0006992FA1|nr:hypothetical protein [Riemerella anatipestifer]MDR7694117.1 hypothetical protein [Riemerella anatipestifer]MDY3528872.1 hypothetical protein [Riemerella anatipestifer]MDY3538087.1 hypothetical protein [Riemerella anatipestifer]
MRKVILYCLFSLSALSSCKKEIRPQKGGIDLISSIYINASKNLENTQSFHISKLNYSNDTIIELVPNISNQMITEEVLFIKDSLFYSLRTPADTETNTILDVVENRTPTSVYSENKKGAIFSKHRIPNYHHKRDLKDTILFNKTYKRFEINSPQSYSRYYVYKTDTLLPYSLYRHAEIDYKGRIERIDTYNKKQDIFVTLQLLPRNNWDEEAKDIFQFNSFIKKKVKK